MSVEEKKLLELQIFDIKDIYDTTKFDDLVTVEDLTHVLEEISLLNKQYRHVHVELKYLMGNEYDGAYGEHAARLEGMRKYISSLKEKIKTIKSAELNSEKDNLVTSLKTEEEIFRERLEKELLEFQMDDVVEIRHNCNV